MRTQTRFLAVFSFTAVACGFAASAAFADTVKGRIASIDPRNLAMRISGPNAHIDLSLEELTRKKNRSLESLDVGNDVVLEVEKTSAGKWMVTSIKKNKEPYAAAKKKTAEPKWLKTPTPDKPSGRKRSLESFPDLTTK